MTDAELSVDSLVGQVGPPLADDDYLTVTMLASGLARIVERRKRAAEGQRQGDGLLPAAWRVGFSRVWWRCREQGEDAPTSDLELMEWCTRPLAAWQLRLSLSEMDLQNCLVVADELSEFAEQASRVGGRDVEAEWIENRVFEAMKTAATVNGGDDPNQVDAIYARLRRMLITRTVLSDRDLRDLELVLPRTDGTGQTFVRRFVDAAYTSRPTTGLVHLLECPGCGNVVADLASTCGTPGCAGGTAQSIAVNALAAVFEQHRAVRLFIHDPGLVEVRIMQALEEDANLRDRIRVRPYPGLDTLDLSIEFLTVDDAGEVQVAQTWGVDAKDYVSARLLGRTFEWPASMPCDRRFLALPNHRASLVGYVDDLTAELEGRVQGVEVVTEKQLLSMVARAGGRLCDK